MKQNLQMQDNKGVRNVFALDDKVVVGPVALVLGPILELNLERTGGEFVFFALNFF